MAVTQQKVMVWCGNFPLFSSPLTEFDARGQLIVRSAWKSSWTMSAVEVFKLNKLPQFSGGYQPGPGYAEWISPQRS